MGGLTGDPLRSSRGRRPLYAFFRLEGASGLVVLGCAVVALAWANLAHESHRLVFGTFITVGIGDDVARFSVLELVNDGLMTFFFVVVGMEIKRELVLGELRTPPQAILPAIAALGGMLVPAAILLAFNAGGPGARGWGIPMATDIAFCIGVLTLLKSRVPHALIVFVTALAIFDDIGGILVIALFYGTGIRLARLLAAAAATVASAVMCRAHVRKGVARGIALAFLWYALHHSGIHATIAGVILGLAIPARSRRSLRWRDHGALSLHLRARPWPRRCRPGRSHGSRNRGAPRGAGGTPDALRPPASGVWSRNLTVKCLAALRRAR